MGWLDLLRSMVREKGGAAVARDLGYARSSISMMLNGKYTAGMGRLAKKVMEVYGMEQIPEGYRKDAYGRLVPLGMIREIDLLRDELVAKIVAEALALQKELAEKRGRWFSDIAAFAELSAEKYGAKLGGNKGNISLLTFDGEYKLVQAIDEHLVFDERLQAAKALIDECIKDWVAGASPEIQVLIDDAFQVDKTGRVNTKRVMSLRRINFEDDRWRRAMEAISDSLQVAGTRAYIRIYRRKPAEVGKYDQIPLGMAGV